MVSIPLVVILLIVSWYLLIRIFPSEVTDVKPARELLQYQIKQMGPLSKKEKMIGLVALATLSTWVFFGEAIDLAVTALLAVAVIFMLGLARWKDAQEEINWGVILLYGVAISLASALSITKVDMWVANILIGTLGTNVLLIMLVLLVTAITLTEFMSNTAAVAIMLPIAFQLGATAGFSPVAAMYLVTIGGGLAFVLPISSPPAAIAYSSGYFTVKEMAKRGIQLDVIIVALFMLFVLFYWPVLGII